MPQRPVQRVHGPGSLAELLDVILDKGIVIDAWARVSLIGIELLTIEARIVVASVETYLRYAEAIGLTALAAAPPTQPATEGRQEGNDSDRALPSAEELQAYLSGRDDGASVDEIATHFDAPRQEVSRVVDEWTDEGLVRRDDERRVYLVADDQE